MKEKIIKICNEVADERPYKQAGNADSYSSYNEGWSDACDILEQRLIKQLLTTEDKVGSAFQPIEGHKIKFIQDIIDRANGKHPSLVYAKKGDYGIIHAIVQDGNYSVTTDDKPAHKFIAEMDKEFILIEPSPKLGAEEILQKVCGYDSTEEMELNDDITVGEALEAMRMISTQQDESPSKLGAEEWLKKHHADYASFFEGFDALDMLVQVMEQYASQQSETKTLPKVGLNDNEKGIIKRWIETGEYQIDELGNSHADITVWEESFGLFKHIMEQFASQQKKS